MKRGSLISLTSRGLFCSRGDFYVDPWSPVERAVVTHAHADHAYRGSKNYLVTDECLPLARLRLDEDAKISSQAYGVSTDLNGVKVSFHPAGHILGSAQVRIEFKGEVWVVSGDYKLTPDATCAALDPVKCDFLITEATFGLPIYRWPPPKLVFAEIDEWWLRNRDRGKASVIFAYALGKAQRVLNGVDRSIGPIFTHGSVESITAVYRAAGIDLPTTTYAGNVTNKKEPWLRRFGSQSTAFASGWMMVRGARRQRAVDRGFVLSDHADWPELLDYIAATRAEKVYVTHGFATEMVRWLKENGTDAEPLKTRFIGDDDAPAFGDEEGEKA